MSRAALPVGELFLLGFHNDGLDHLGQFYDKFGLGGVILFDRNCSSPDETSALIREVRSLTSNDILVAIDQEGGRVNRISGADFPTFPSAAYYGSRADIDGVRHATEITASRLLAIGINLNMNPVADVFVNEDNRILKSRCFSSNAEVAAKFVSEVVRIQNDAGIASCAKHFPGLGDSSIDPHLEMALSSQPVQRFEDVMFPPFEAAVEQGCPAIMTTHISAPSLDPDHIATFSRNVVDGILRKRLGFDGVVITDDLDMAAIGDIPDAVPRALIAGHDIVLICHSVDKQLYCAEQLVAMADDPNLRESLSASVRRVRSLKQRFAV